MGLVAVLVAASVAPRLARAQPGSAPLVVDPGAGPASFTVSTPSRFDSVRVAAGGTLVVNAPLTVDGDFVVEDAGLVRQEPDAAAGDGGLPGLLLSVDGGLRIEPGGLVDLTGAGLPPSTVVDALTGLPRRWDEPPGSSAGGSHRSAGGCSAAASSSGFDDALEPRWPGGGSLLSRGGGALVARARWARIDGAIVADGQPDQYSGGYTGGGGAGGTVALEVAGAFEGTGTLSARGGGTSGHERSCGGAGGLVRVRADQQRFSGAILLVAGGGDYTRAFATSGAPGTALQLVGVERPSVHVVAGEYVLRGTETLEALTLEAGTSVRVSGPAAVRQPVTVSAGTTLLLASPRALERLALAPLVSGALHVQADVVAPRQALELGSTARLVVDARLGVERLEARGGARVTHDAGVRRMALEASGRMAFEREALVDARGLGLPVCATVDVETGDVLMRAANGCGGSHGGRGGCQDGGATAPRPYGDATAPGLAGGGGGGWSTSGSCAGFCGDSAGGGVVSLRAGELVVDGAILADGTAGAGGSAAHCAGGSVVVTAGSLAGAGLIAARGGVAALDPAPTTAGGGGGGRVALFFGHKSFDGGLSAAGGRSTVAPGEPGTLHEATVPLPPAVVSTPPRHAPAGRALVYAARASGAPPFPWTLVEGPGGATLDPVGGQLTWTPGALGPVRFAVAVANTFGDAGQAFEVDVVDDASTEGGVRAPSFLSSPGTTATCGVPYRYGLDGAPRVAGTGPLRFSLARVLDAPLPPGLTVDVESGDLSWTPSQSEAGLHPLELVVEGPGGTARQAFVVDVDCPPPTGFGPGCGCEASPGALVAMAVAVGLALLRLRRARRRPRQSVERSDGP